MATASGEAPARRRKGRGRKEPSTPAEIGTALLRARQALGLGLVDVRDRTGVPLAVLEALESRRPRADAEPRCRPHRPAPVRRPGRTRQRGPDPGARPGHAGTGPGGRGDRGPGDTGCRPRHRGRGPAAATRPPVGSPATCAGTRATACTSRPSPRPPRRRRSARPRPPGAWSAGGHDPYGSGQVFGTTGMYPATPPLRIRQVVRPAAWPVRALVWLTAAALVVAGLGLVVAHVEPKWMRTIHLARVPHRASTPAASHRPRPGDRPGDRPPRGGHREARS